MMEVYTLAVGKIKEELELVKLIFKMGLFMKGNGIKICKKDMGEKYIQMEMYM